MARQIARTVTLILLLLPALARAQPVERPHRSHQRDAALQDYLTALNEKNRDHAPESALATLEKITSQYDPNFAVSVLARLEDLDTRLRLDRLPGVDAELRSME